MRSRRKYYFGSTKIAIYRLASSSRRKCDNCGDKATHIVGVGANSLFDNPIFHDKECCWRCVQQLHHGDVDVITGNMIIDPMLELLQHHDPILVGEVAHGFTQQGL